MTLRETDLSLSVEQFDGLWDRVNRARANAKVVTVDRSALASVLTDHGRMAGELFPAPSVGKGKWECPKR